MDLWNYPSRVESVKVMNETYTKMIRQIQCIKNYHNMLIGTLFLQKKVSQFCEDIHKIFRKVNLSKIAIIY